MTSKNPTMQVVIKDAKYGFYEDGKFVGAAFFDHKHDRLVDNVVEALGYDVEWVSEPITLTYTSDDGDGVAVWPETLTPPKPRWECVRVDHRKAFLGEYGKDTGATWRVEFNDDCGSGLIRDGNGDCPYTVGKRYDL